jgi:hypothetical protein
MTDWYHLNMMTTNSLFSLWTIPGGERYYRSLEIYAAIGGFNGPLLGC